VVFITPPLKMLNTTPHSITFKTTTGDFITIPPASKEIQSKFRAIAKKANEIDPIDIGSGAKVTTTEVPEYNVDIYDFDLPENTETVIVSTITAEALRVASKSTGLIDTELLFDRSVKIVVPYSGPDETKCYRENGIIKWVSEVMRYG
jgi:hypothetical protein